MVDLPLQATGWPSKNLSSSFFLRVCPITFSKETHLEDPVWRNRILSTYTYIEDPGINYIWTIIYGLYGVVVSSSQLSLWPPLLWPSTWWQLLLQRRPTFVTRTLLDLSPDLRDLSPPRICHVLNQFISGGLNLWLLDGTLVSFRYICYEMLMQSKSDQSLKFEHEQNKSQHVPFQTRPLIFHMWSFEAVPWQ